MRLRGSTHLVLLRLLLLGVGQLRLQRPLPLLLRPPVVPVLASKQAGEAVLTGSSMDAGACLSRLQDDDNYADMGDRMKHFLRQLETGVCPTSLVQFTPQANPVHIV